MPLSSHLLYIAKHSRGKTFTFFADFQLLDYCKSFPVYVCMLVALIHYSWWHLRLVHKTFPVKGVFSCNCKMFPLNVLPYMVYFLLYNTEIHQFKIIPIVLFEQITKYITYYSTYTVVHYAYCKITKYPWCKHLCSS